MYFFVSPSTCIRAQESFLLRDVDGKLSIVVKISHGCLNNACTEHNAEILITVSGTDGDNDVLYDIRLGDPPCAAGVHRSRDPSIEIFKELGDLTADSSWFQVGAHVEAQVNTVQTLMTSSLGPIAPVF